MNEIEIQITQVADQLLDEGEMPSVTRIAEILHIDTSVAELPLLKWMQAMKVTPETDPVSRRTARISPPELMSQQINQLWELALDEAQILIRDEVNSERVGDQEERRVARDMVRDIEQRYQELERRYREQGQSIDKATQASRALEAEINVLKANLASETNQRKKHEQIRANVESELAQLRKQHEDTKKLFDQRIKEEQRQALEAVSRAEVEARHYRNALEKIRDDAGRSEAELTRSSHELQAQVARKDARIDMQEASIKDLEKELEELKQSLATYSREIATLNSKLLKETNANRRLETQVKDQEEDARRLNQRLALGSNEAAKRENALRQQLKEREEQLVRATTRINSLEKRLTAQEDQIRRLNARL